MNHTHSQANGDRKVAGDRDYTAWVMMIFSSAPDYVSCAVFVFGKGISSAG